MKAEGKLTTIFFFPFNNTWGSIDYILFNNCNKSLNWESKYISSVFTYLKACINIMAAVYPKVKKCSASSFKRIEKTHPKPCQNEWGKIIFLKQNFSQFLSWKTMKALWIILLKLLIKWFVKIFVNHMLSICLSERNSKGKMSA